jgi:hypothetical protein
MDNSLTLIKEKTRFYISTPDRAAEALLFCKNLENFAEEIKKSVKERTVKLMDEQGNDSMIYTITDQDTGEVREWSVKRDYNKETKEYRIDNVIEAFGIDIAKKFMKIGKTDLDRFMKKEVSKGTITSEQTFIAVSDPIVKVKKGSGVIMREIK